MNIFHDQYWKSSGKREDITRFVTDGSALRPMIELADRYDRYICIVDSTEDALVYANPWQDAECVRMTRRGVVNEQS